MQSLIIGSAVLLSSVSGAVVSFLVYMKSINYLLRHSRYKNCGYDLKLNWRKI